MGGSGKAKVPKTEEIQSLEYRFRIESEAGSEWEAEDSQSTTSQANTGTYDISTCKGTPPTFIVVAMYRNSTCTV